MEKLTRSSVMKREKFLKKLWDPSLRVWQVGVKKFQDNQRALTLLIDIQERYEHDEISLASEIVQEPQLSWEIITHNGKYSLD